MSLLFAGKLIDFPNSACPEDSAETVMKVTNGASKGKRVKTTRKGFSRKKMDWWSGFCLHTDTGRTDKLSTEAPISIRDWLLAQYQTSTDREASWHVSNDGDGSMIQSADLMLWTCWHASQVNQYMAGMENVDIGNGTLTKIEMQRCVDFLKLWTYHTGVPRLIAWRDGKPYAGKLTRCTKAMGSGKSVCAIIGHRNVWGLNKAGNPAPYRGPKDPSDYPFLEMSDAGFLKLDIEKNEDLEYWKDIQASLGVHVDGIPGYETRVAYWKKHQKILGASFDSDSYLGTPRFIELQKDAI